MTKSRKRNKRESIRIEDGKDHIDLQSASERNGLSCVETSAITLKGLAATGWLGLFRVSNRNPRLLEFLRFCCSDQKHSKPRARHPHHLKCTDRRSTFDSV
jgi:hypothetical protein